MGNNTIPTISVIVPVFNNAKYLYQCIISVLDQTFRDFELLLINDGSTDNSGKICDDLALNDKRIKVFHQINSGVSCARNKGIDNASGRYICFVDSDDYIENNFLEDLLNNCIEANSDIVCCSYKIFDEKSQNFKYISTFPFNDNGKTVLLELIRKKHLLPLFTCLMKRSIILSNSIKFTEGCRYGEDQEFIYKALLHSSQVQSFQEYNYNYRRHESSAMSKANLDNFGYSEAMIRTLNYIKELYPENRVLINLFEYLKVPNSIICSVIRLYKSGTSDHVILNEMKRRDLLYYLEKAKYRSLKDLFVLLWKISPTLYFKCLHIFFILRKIFTKLNNN